MRTRRNKVPRRVVMMAREAILATPLLERLCQGLGAIPTHWWPLLVRRRCLACRYRLSPEDERVWRQCCFRGPQGKGDLKGPVCFARGIPIREAKKIPRALAALDFERKKLWGMSCWIEGSATDGEVRQPRWQAERWFISDANARSASKSTASSRRMRENTNAESCSKGPSSQITTQTLQSSGSWHQLHP